MRDQVQTENAPTGAVESRRFMVIFNPVAGHRRRRYLQRVLDRLMERGCRYVLKETTCRGDAERFCAMLQPGDCDAVLVAGGDGTINEAVNGLGGTPVPVGIIPTGTANVMAWELGMPHEAEAVADFLATVNPRLVYSGILGDRRFVMMAGAGFDARVVAAVTPQLKRRLRKFAYVLKSAALLFRFDSPAYQVTLDGVSYPAASVVIANGHYYGGQFVCAPEADLADPDLHVCLFKRQGRWAAAMYALWLLIGRLHRRHDFEVRRARDILLDGPAGDPVQADGDVAGALPVHITASPSTFRVLAA